MLRALNQHLNQHFRGRPERFVPRPGISKTRRFFRKRRRLLDINRRVLTKKCHSITYITEVPRLYFGWVIGSFDEKDDDYFSFS